MYSVLLRTTYVVRSTQYHTWDYPGVLATAFSDTFGIAFIHSLSTEHVRSRLFVDHAGQLSRSWYQRCRGSVMQDEHGRRRLLMYVRRTGTT